MIPFRLEVKARKFFDASQAPNPGAISALSMTTQQTALIERPSLVFGFQRLLDTLWKGLRYLWKLVLIPVFLIFLGALTQAFFIHKGIVVVVKSHDPIECQGQRP